MICVSNPDENASGSLQIDPRLGTTPAALAPQISAYSAQIPAYDSAVQFPRERRSVKYRQLSFKDLYKSAKYGNEHKIRKRQSCTCVPAGTCLTGGSSGAGMIDFRIVTPVSYISVRFTRIVPRSKNLQFLRNGCISYLRTKVNI